MTMAPTPPPPDKAQRAAAELKALTRAAHEAAADLKALSRQARVQVDDYARDQVQAGLAQYSEMVNEAVHRFLREMLEEARRIFTEFNHQQHAAFEDWSALYTSFAGTVIAAVSTPDGVPEQRRLELVDLGRRMAEAMDRLGISYETAPVPDGHRGAHLVIDTTGEVPRMHWSDSPEGQAVLERARYEVVINPPVG